MSVVPINLTPQNAVNTLIASSNDDFRRELAETLRASRWRVAEALGGAEALIKMEEEPCHILLLDNWLPDLDVKELVGIVRERFPGVSVLVVDSKTGALLLREESTERPHESTILALIERIRADDRDSAFELAPPLVKDQPLRLTAEESPLPEMIGRSAAMRKVYHLARLVAPRNTAVLIIGETGTGKELVARAIHTVGPRSKQPFITVNCAAIPEPLLEAELFGHARGAFTGAFQSRIGRIHAAHGGTLFLDEVGELPLAVQAKLLRFLQEGEVQRLGSPDVVRVDVRVIAATNADLQQRVAKGEFREDLYYRLDVFPLEVVPLRERPEDIFPLSVHFLEELCEANQAPGKKMSEAALRILAEHHWPGNVRELSHVIERAFIFSQNSPEILPEHISIRNLRQTE